MHRSGAHHCIVMFKPILLVTLISAGCEIYRVAARQENRAPSTMTPILIALAFLLLP
jgi:hypothetical protein